jgi:hypothetical protein
MEEDYRGIEELVEGWQARAGKDRVAR